MRIVFIGNVEFSRRALSRLFELEAEIVGVVTRESSSFNSDHVDLAPLARGKNIPVLHQADLATPDAQAWLAQLRPEMIFCFGWSRLLPKAVLDLAPKGVVGFHPAPLPRGRGRHPIIWTLVLGLSETASTFFVMDGAADTGDILSQSKILVRPQDDARILYDRICDTALVQLEEFLPELSSGRLRPIPQDHAKASVWRKRTASDGKVDWRMPGQGIANLVRGLARPYPGAHFQQASGLDVKIWRTSPSPLEPAEDIEPGRILEVTPEGFDVRCGDGAIRVLEFEGEFQPRRGGWLP